MTGLFGSTALEVLVGLIFIFFLLSVICSSINEMLAGLLKWRAKDLERGIANMLSDPQLVQAVLEHPLIKTLGNDAGEVGPIERLARVQPQDAAAFQPGKYGAGKPSYIPARTFSFALFDALVPATENILSVERLRQVALNRATNGATLETRNFGQSLLPVIDQSSPPGAAIQGLNDLQQFLKNLAGQAAADAPLLAQIDQALTLDDLRQIAAQLGAPEARQAALQAIDGAQARLDAVRAGVEDWFNAVMDRLSGVYKRRVQVYLFWIGLLVSVIFGADTIRMIQIFNSNPALRQFAVTEANQFVSAGNGTNGGPAPGAPTQSLTSTVTVTITGTSTTTVTTVTSPSFGATLNELQQFSALFGYDDVWTEPDGGRRLLLLLGRLPGILITSFAITFGAPFWFDLLNKITNLRNSGPPPDTQTATKKV
jgi:hypothetical protein